MTPLSIFTLLLLNTVVALNNSGKKTTKTLVIKQNYDGPHQGWLSIDLHNPDGKTQIDQVTWCSTIFVPRVGEVPRDIRECHAEALLHKQIVPGPSEYYRLNTRRLMVNPASVGGFWLDRPADLIIHGTLDNHVRLEQIVRINPQLSLYDGDVGTFTKMDEYQQETTTQRIHTHAPPVNTGNVELHNVAHEEEQEQVVHIGNTHPPSGTAELPVEEETSYMLTPVQKSYLTIGSIGILLMLITMAVVIGRRRVVHELQQQSSSMGEFVVVHTSDNDDDDMSLVVLQPDVDYEDVVGEQNTTTIGHNAAARMRRNLERLAQMGNNSKRK